jgi:hypothetical protein
MILVSMVMTQNALDLVGDAGASRDVWTKPDLASVSLLRLQKAHNIQSVPPRPRYI